MRRSAAFREAARLSSAAGTPRVKAALARALFRQTAAAWDAWYGAFHRAEDTDLGPLADRLSRLARGGRLLEVGCGDCRLLAELAGRCRRVDGVDPSARALAFARGSVSGLRNVRLLRLEDWSLPFPDGTFDAVVCQRTLNILDPEAALLMLGEARRVLRPGGRVAFNLANFHHEPFLSALTTPGASPWPSLTRPRYWTEEMVRAALPRVGLEVVSLKAAAWIDVVAQQSATNGRRPRAAQKSAKAPAVR
ncbi:class I SAM-dependent methyltransferase [bacterium]|nr:MAG: class I SAM-dependent methyltransferase [bacterium]